MQGAKRSVELTAEAQGQRARLLQQTETMGKTSSRLEQTNRIVHETEEIGSAILTDLAQQRETLQSTRDKVRTAARARTHMQGGTCFVWPLCRVGRHFILASRTIAVRSQLSPSMPFPALPARSS